MQSSDAFARALGYPQSPLDDWLVFHLVFGKTVPDISLNAVANLGYADGRFLKPVYPGETLSAVSEVIGLKESSSRRTGIVYVRSTGFEEPGERGADLLPLGARQQARSPPPGRRDEHVPDLPKAVDPAALGRPARPSTRRPMTTASPARPSALPTTRRASASTMSTA